MQLALYLTREKALNLLVTSLFLLFVVMLPRYTDTAKTWFMLLNLIALGYLVLSFSELKNTTLAERGLFAAIIVNFLWIVFTFYANGAPDLGASFVWSRHIYFLFFIPLFFLCRKVVISNRAIVFGLFGSVAVSLIDILIDLAQGIDHRLQGMNPNGFGPIQLCMSGILLFYFIKGPRSRLRWVALAGSILGIANVVFSQSRSTWVTLGLLGIFFAIYLLRSQPVWKKTLLVAIILLLISGSYLLPMVKVRVDQGVASVSNYLATDDYRDASRYSSIGVRFELWKTAWYIFLDNPVVGVGVGGFKPAARANSERYQVSQVVHRYKYVHNQYLAALASRGAPGLVLFLLVICLPVYIAMSQKAQENKQKNETDFAGLAVLVICLNYLIGSLAEDHFEGKSAPMFVIVMLALLLARISSGRSRTISETNL